MRRTAWLLALALGLAGPAHAQLARPLPAAGKLGVMAGKQPYPQVLIDSKPLRLAPGGRIIDEHNRTIIHSYLPEMAYVLFVQDGNGDVSRLYLLRPDEVEQLKARP